MAPGTIMSVEIIPLDKLLLTFLPAIIVVYLMWRWSLDYGKALYAMLRMLIQLLAIGYALVMIFQSDQGVVTMLVLLVMLIASSWIALNTMDVQRSQLVLASFLSIAIGGGLTLALVSQIVLQLDPWYAPRYMIPLAGMIFANAMTSISLSGERLQAEIANGHEYKKARGIALSTALIPIINSMFAVGLVSLPGMMTGQILAGVEPIIAARYQIMVMCMLFGASGISSALFLHFVSKHFEQGKLRVDLD